MAVELSLESALWYIDRLRPIWPRYLDSSIPNCRSCHFWAVTAAAQVPPDAGSIEDDEELEQQILHYERLEAQR